MAAPDGFTIRRKAYDFHAAPVLSEPDAYVSAIWVDGAVIRGGRFARALDAAIDAARMSHDAIASGRVGERCAMVGCDHPGPRPSGAMKGYMTVSYRPRFHGPQDRSADEIAQVRAERAEKRAAWMAKREAR